MARNCSQRWYFHNAMQPLTRIGRGNVPIRSAQMRVGNGSTRGLLRPLCVGLRLFIKELFIKILQKPASNVRSWRGNQGAVICFWPCGASPPSRSVRMSLPTQRRLSSASPPDPDCEGNHSTAGRQAPFPLSQAMRR